MSKEHLMAEGLDMETPVVEGTEVKTRRKEQTQEQVEEIVAGVAKMKEMGLSEKAGLILENLAPVWNGSDKEAIQEAKEAVIEAFGGSEALKDYVDGEFVADMQAFAGIARCIPISNNIKSFYARRATSKKVKKSKVNIGGTIYEVSTEYLTEIADKSSEDKRELLLAHPDTVQYQVEELL